MSEGARRSPQAVPSRPLRSAVLIGGASRRMGVPKHRIDLGSETLLERTVRILGELSRAHPDCGLRGQVVAIGAGELPSALGGMPRLADAPDLSGPVAGIVAALASSRAEGDDAGWLILACDLPRIEVSSLLWLVGERRSGQAAVQARVAASRVEPFPGIYEARALAALEQIGRAPGGGASLQRLDEFVEVGHPAVPVELAPTFRGANSPAELAQLSERSAIERAG